MGFIKGGGASSGGGGGALALIATITLAAPGTIDFTAIPSTPYKDLIIAGIIQGTNGGSTETLFCHINNDSGSNYDYEDLAWSGGSGVVRFGAALTTFMNLGDHAIPSSPPAQAFADFEMTIYNYASSIPFKAMRTLVNGPTGGSGSNQISGSVWHSTAAINRVTLFGGFTANLATGSSLRLYGRT